jgi:hypothetical protein
MMAKQYFIKIFVILILLLRQILGLLLSSQLS